ncbi:adenine-specific DNA-methyltransferase [Peptoclostridium litorale DSM 5388]|uniref:site-specific DNA-methyltransferase (adenine-specific) n=2 Tax=Peptoclostridium litorale TaxID=1557 RepID=A0A069RHS7_PEPLI|nr:hypothetical protein CLIT_10c04170 [Peptoclostridium litorale DSM 5388]SIO01172.1 adenine-specific DNA-methyltransferase [Peptoclostridium litorale DSM 5388]
MIQRGYVLIKGFGACRFNDLHVPRSWLYTLNSGVVICMDIVKRYIDFYENCKNAERLSSVKALEKTVGMFKSEIHSMKVPQKYEGDSSLMLSELFEGILSKTDKSSKGVFYTDELLSKYMAEKAISMYFEDCENNQMVKKLKNIRILDPSCGCGAFVVACFRKLVQLNMDMYPQSEYEEICRYVLEKNIYAVDVDQRALYICKERLSIITGIEGLKLNFYNEDFITDFEKKNFDIIIGNPPYIGEKGNKEIFEIARENEFGKLYYEKGMDYFYYFIEKAADISRKQGLICFITTNYWTGADYSKKLRSKISENCTFRWVADFNDFKVFPQATGQHNMIFILQKSGSNIEFCYEKLEFSRGKLSNALVALECKEEGLVSSSICKTSEVFDKNGRILFMDSVTKRITDKILMRSDCLLGEVSSINQGIVSGADRATARNLKHINEKDMDGIREKDGIFILRESELFKVGVQDPLGEHPVIKPFYKSTNVKRYYTDDYSKMNSGESAEEESCENLYILYIDKHTDMEKYPEIISHLEKFKPILEKRREAQNGIIPWYSLHWPRKRDVFEGEKIVVPQRARYPVFGYNSCPWYASADIYYITRFNISPLYILGILNSKLSHYWLYNRGKRKGEYLELYQKPLSRFPIKTATEKDQHRVEEIVRKLVEMTEMQGGSGEYQSLQRDIDSMIYYIYGMTNEEIECIEKA